MHIRHVSKTENWNIHNWYIKEKNKLFVTSYYNRLIFLGDTYPSLPKNKIKSIIGIHKLSLDVDNLTTLVWTADFKVQDLKLREIKHIRLSHKHNINMFIIFITILLGKIF